MVPVLLFAGFQLCILHAQERSFNPEAYGYHDSCDIRINLFSIPEIPVVLNGKTFWVQLDFGTAGNPTFTTAIEKQITFEIVSEQATYNADGSHRGSVKNVTIPSVTILGEDFINQQAVLADWKIYSTLPFNGNIGLSFFSGKRITIDYPARKLYVSTTPLPDTVLDTQGRPVIACENPPPHFPTGLFVKGIVQEKETLVYIDSGSSRSFINETLFPQWKTVTGICLGDANFAVPALRGTRSINFQDFPVPIGLTLGSDFLKSSVITIDRTNGQNRIILLKKR